MHNASVLAYADDITLIPPSMTGLRKMSTICEQYGSEYDILFNGSKNYHGILNSNNVIQSDWSKKIGTFT